MSYLIKAVRIFDKVTYIVYIFTPIWYQPKTSLCRLIELYVLYYMKNLLRNKNYVS